MPRSRSLFASLPYDLRRSIKSRPEEPLLPIPSPLSTPSLLVDPDGLLPTQPPSPSPPMAGAASQLGPTREPFSAMSSASKAVPDSRETPNRKKRKRVSSGLESTDHTGHAWDCTGLVTRYTDYSHLPDELRKYFAQRHLYFSQYDRLPLLIDDVGWYSITPQPIAAHIANRCQSDVIIDAFCGVGGNAIEFARTCERVIAIDNDRTRLRLARHNALHCGVADRIEFVLADFTEWAAKRAERVGDSSANSAVDVVFLSPPWGGPEYLSYGKKYSLSAVEPIPGDELYRLAHAITPNIAFYLPKNVDLQELSELASNLDTTMHAGPAGSERHREWVEIEEEWVGEKLKAITAYYGGLVAE